MLNWLITVVWDLDEILKTEVFTLLGVRVTVATLVALGVVVFATGMLSRWMGRGLERAAERRGTADQVSVAHTKRLASYLVWLVGAWLGLEAVGIRLDALFAAGAVVAVGLGIALQPDAESVIAGIILLFERTIRPGDTLLLEGEPVLVMHMRLRSSIVRNLDGLDVVMPNRELVHRKVAHLTFEGCRYRLRVRLRLPFGEDVDAIDALLTEAARRMEWGDGGEDAEVRIVDIEPSGVCWEVQVWSGKPMEHEERVSELHAAVIVALQGAGIAPAGQRIDLTRDQVSSS